MMSHYYAVELWGKLIPCVDTIAWTSRVEAELTAAACGGRVVEVLVARRAPAGPRMCLGADRWGDPTEIEIELDEDEIK